MEQGTSTATGSEGNLTSGDASGSLGDGSGAGTQTADSFAAERSQLEQRARDFQSRADREAARATELEQRLAALEARENGDAGGTATEFDPELFATRLEERFERRAQLKEAAANLRSEFGYADTAIFEQAAKFDSVDALKAAAEASHARVASIVEAQVAEGLNAIKADVLAKYGINLSSPSDSGSAPDGKPSLAQIQAMSLSEMSAFEAANPGVIDEVLRSAT